MGAAPGRLIAVVGPSGVGKDSVMEALATATDFHLVRRVITRPSAAGSEQFDGCDEDAFDADLTRGRFALHWPAHDLRYGIPKTELACLDQGRNALVNLSRKVLMEAHTTFPGFIVVNLSASPKVLVQRLAARGRESADSIAKRLARQVDLPAGLTVINVVNDGPLDETVRTTLARLADQDVADAPSATREIS
ncbi:phosphonate metabolism protein/1,5-bisphosphokinase (PRPP-forming) PhnN [Aliiroseovarius sp. PrR006]|uniref:phosphonate metabolism protein/1,5-bisphosphokinase (PRPP-forming) PhnN n=1 Tax=Aliiroseovarius sp. PrR006 TaxID=2706883 RepID=UPI0013D39167|nr:phosphonate metabolism protein/1,5-bisphosphokinase (PRPP-forming) PhnN [Aliiroseovarius sp. PrR006]NDW53684.1 phosphonate metabolism protein/1,5-bisphosphokinase (PRPP-forming) PhnN [Aliiroseovarius sp. PrR006]